jgi:uridine kinase
MMTRGECLVRLADLIAALRLEHPTRVAIDGVDGAGKTMLADELAERLEALERQAIRASIDDFAQPSDIRYRRDPETGDSYFLDAFDYPSARRVLLDPLGPHGDRRFRVASFDILSDRYVDTPLRTADVNAILLCDGVFLQRPELEECWDFRVWVDAPFDVTVPRAVTRDATRGFDAAARRSRYERRYVPGQQLYLARCRPRERADVVCNNTDPSAPSLSERRGHGPVTHSAET